VQRGARLKPFVNNFHDPILYSVSYVKFVQWNVKLRAAKRRSLVTSVYSLLIFIFQTSPSFGSFQSKIRGRIALCCESVHKTPWIFGAGDSPPVLLLIQAFSLLIGPKAFPSYLLTVTERSATDSLIPNCGMLNVLAKPNRQCSLNGIIV